MDPLPPCFVARRALWGPHSQVGGKGMGFVPQARISQFTAFRPGLSPGLAPGVMSLQVTGPPFNACCSLSRATTPGRVVGRDWRP